MRTVLLALGLLMLFATACQAAESALVCAQDYGPSGSNPFGAKIYRVQATLRTSEDLDRATNSTRFGYGKLFAVIFWRKHQVSIISMDPLLNNWSYFPWKGEDQEGRQWELSLYQVGAC